MWLISSHRHTVNPAPTLTLHDTITHFLNERFTGAARLHGTSVYWHTTSWLWPSLSDWASVSSSFPLTGSPPLQGLRAPSSCWCWRSSCRSCRPPCWPPSWTWRSTGRAPPPPAGPPPLWTGLTGCCSFTAVLLLWTSTSSDCWDAPRWDSSSPFTSLFCFYLSFSPFHPSLVPSFPCLAPSLTSSSWFPLPRFLHWSPSLLTSLVAFLLLYLLLTSLSSSLPLLPLLQWYLILCHPFYEPVSCPLVGPESGSWWGSERVGHNNPPHQNLPKQTIQINLFCLSGEIQSVEKQPEKEEPEFCWSAAASHQVKPPEPGLKIHLIQLTFMTVKKQEVWSIFCLCSSDWSSIRRRPVKAGSPWPRRTWPVWMEASSSTMSSSTSTSSESVRREINEGNH